MNCRLAWIACLVLGTAGCCHHRSPCPAPACCPTPGRPLPPGTIFPGPPAPAAAAAPVPETPPPAWPAPAPQAPAPPIPAVRNYPPVAAVTPPSNWQPNDSRAEPPMMPQLGRPEPVVTEARSSPSLPAGIPQFAYAADRVAAGQRPMADGFDWLQTNGFKTVLFVRQPGEDETADRREVTQRGMKYLTLTYGPQTLSRQILDEFNRLVADPTGQPLFVYDRNGVWAGSLWYAHFRTAGKLPDSEAQTRAARLGLRTPDDPEQRTLWSAMQKSLSGLP